jgi:hypothetical protein
MRSVEQALKLVPDLPHARDLRHEILLAITTELAKQGLVTWNGEKPAFAHEPVVPTPGPPMSQWIIDNRR